MFSKIIPNIEHNLPISEELFRSLISNIPGIAYRYDLSIPPQLTFISDGVKAITGHPTAAFLQAEISWRELIVPEDRFRVGCMVEMSIADHTPHEIEYRIRHADGSIRWIRERGRAIYNTKNQALHLDGVMIDITACKQSEEARYESEMRFQTLANAAPAFIWISDTSNRCTWFNQQWLTFTGRSLEQECRGGWTQSVHQEDLERCLEIDARSFAQRIGFEMEYRLRRADGEFRWILDRGTPCFLPNGEFLGYTGSCIDITDYKRVMAKLDESNQYKHEFIATLSHELRNPLAPLHNALNILQQQPNTDSTTTTRLYDMMERQVTHLMRLVDDLLEASRITRGAINLCKQRTDLKTCIHMAIEMTRPLIESAEHQLTVIEPAEPITLEADAIRLVQIFANLLNNATRYTRNGGHIWLTAARENGKALVSVRDSGVGISAEMLPRVFEIFTQIDRTQRHAQGGLGVGLTLVQNLVQMHGGHVEARSAGAGQGSEFLVYLPLAPTSVVTPST